VNTSFDEIADDVVMDEAYPHLGAPVPQFIERYLSAPETVLLHAWCRPSAARRTDMSNLSTSRRGERPLRALAGPRRVRQEREQRTLRRELQRHSI
jgi:hypothetical protein